MTAHPTRRTFWVMLTDAGRLRVLNVWDVGSCHICGNLQTAHGDMVAGCVAKLESFFLALQLPVTVIREKIELSQTC